MDDGKSSSKKLFMCLIDYKKAFDCVDHQRLWCTLKDMGVPEHLVVVLRNLYTNQESTVRIEYGETRDIPIGKEVRQGCILSPLLFNIYEERIMRDVLEKWDKGISISGRKVTNLRYADDTTLIAVTKDDLSELLTKVKRTSEEAGLYLNVKKTKVITTGKLDHIIVDDNNIAFVDKFIFMGVLITNDVVTDKELRSRLAIFIIFINCLLLFYYLYYIFLFFIL